jgi:hypothetical protein
MMADGVPSMVAVLEQIARSTEATLGQIHAELREMRGAQNTYFRWPGSPALRLTEAPRPQG